MSAPSSVTFSDLGVPAVLVEQLAAEGKTEAFPIQQDTLSDTLAGRDVLGRGKTGSGKTLAFSIPMVARLAADAQSGPRRGRPARGLVLAPTRELATQITTVLDPLAKASGLTTTTIFGGVKQKRQETALSAGVDIIVACPGRLEDLLQQGLASLEDIEITVLDEADHMADMGFLPGVTRLLAKTPPQGQRMFFSATLDNDVDKLVRRFLHDPVLHSVDDPTSHVSAMTHHVFEVTAEDKADLVRHLASGTGRRILFTRTKHRAKRLARQLTGQGIPAVDMHGNLSQAARERNLSAFAEGEVRVLVATDVAARGVHVDAVELVVHVDPPTEHKAYLHRSGRTARAGSDGDVVTIMMPDERKDTLSLLRKAAIKAKPQQVTTESAEVSDLVGEIAPRVEPQPKESVSRTNAQVGGSSEHAHETKRASRRRRGGRGRSRTGEQKDSGRTQGGPSQGSRTQGGRSQGNRSQGGRSQAERTDRTSSAESRGTSAETRRRNRSRGGGGGSRPVYSTSS